MNAPQLRIRPVKSEVKETEPTLSSPLARRGASERHYLQGQLRAEAHIRRRQELQNEERKRRESGDLVAGVEGVTDRDDGKDATTDGDMLNMMEKLNFGDDNMKRFMPKRKGASRHEAMEMAASPPAILMKTFKRSVSAVLADSGIEENSNLLFFPNGVPLLKDVDEAENDAAAETASQGSLRDECDNGLDGSLRASPRSRESSTSDEISPSLVAADIVWQFGSFDYDDIPGDLTVPTAKSTSKKVTLRPKMKTQKHNITTPEPPSREFKPIRSRFKSCDSASSSDSRSKGCVTFETPDKFSTIRRDDALAASESFQQLSFDGPERTRSRERLGSDFSIRTHDSAEKKEHPQQFVFSSPGAPSFRKSLAACEFSKEPLSDSNFKTPDNSENSRRPSRSRLCAAQRMPKLPELSMPEALDVPFRGRGRASEALEASDRQEDKALSLLAEAAALDLKEPFPAANFKTPDNSYNDRRSRRSLTEMPRLPVFGQPSGPTGPSQQQAALGDNAMPSKALETISIKAQRAISDGDNCVVPCNLQPIRGVVPNEPAPESSLQTLDQSILAKRLADLCTPPSISYLQNAHASCREEDAESSLGAPNTPCSPSA
ncbi:hypothetical protein ACHAXT_000579 [Thalassiosira profunda]